MFFAGSSSATAARPGSGQPLLLRLGEVRIRVAGGAGAVVARRPETAGVPHVPPWLLGVVVHEGEALPLVDLGLVLGVRVRDARRMLVHRDAGFPVAFAVDDVDADRAAEPAREVDLTAVTRTLLTGETASVA